MMNCTKAMDVVEAEPLLGSPEDREPAKKKGKPRKTSPEAKEKERLKSAKKAQNYYLALAVIKTGWLPDDFFQMKSAE